MGMSGGNGKGSAVSEINVTPLIDVLLVLLILFMVIVPVAPKGLAALVPQPPQRNQPENLDLAIVVSVSGLPGEAPSYRINQDQIPKPELEARLEQIYAVRQDKAMFVKGDPNLTYSTMAEVIDMGHRAGVERVGLITPKVDEGD